MAMKWANKTILIFIFCTVIYGGNAHARTVLQNKGSDTLVNVAQAWAEKYQEVNHDVAVAVSGGGSGTGIAALINGTVDIANSSREMDAKELEEAKIDGVNPVEYIVGYDALAIYLHPNNPLSSFSLAQLKNLYGRSGTAKHWTDLGVEVAGCRKQQIVLVGRQNNSGTYMYFHEAVLGKKEKYTLGTLDMHGSKDVVDLVEKTPCAIGYSGIAYATDHVNVACVTKTDGGECILPTLENTISRHYPISRPLFMYTNGEASGAIKDYLDWILSDDGQCIIAHIGYAPVRHIQCGKE